MARSADFSPAAWTQLSNLALAFKEIPDGALPEIKKAYPGTNQETAAQLLQHMTSEERRFLFGDKDTGQLGVVDEAEAAAEREAVRVNMRQRQQQRQAAWPEG